MAYARCRHDVRYAVIIDFMLSLHDDYAFEPPIFRHAPPMLRCYGAPCARHVSVSGHTTRRYTFSTPFSIRLRHFAAMLPLMPATIDATRHASADATAALLRDFAAVDIAADADTAARTTLILSCAPLRSLILPR